MSELQFKVPSKINILAIVLLLIGIISGIYGFISDPVRTWANYLICNYYFIALVIGVTFFAAIQSITQSGWSAMFKRIPEAIGGYLPVAAVLMLIFVLFGSHTIYKWMHTDIVKEDELMQHKSLYLNFTFYAIRSFVFFALWILFTKLFRKLSIKEDNLSGTDSDSSIMNNFNKIEFYSKVYIFILALTFSLASYDWIMSIDGHWFSTLFAGKNFISAFLNGAAAIFLTVMLLHKAGYFPDLNLSHLHDFSRYLFMLSLIWGYMWFAQYFLIWYGNIPEETIYYSSRLSQEWRFVFFTNIVISWMFPFLFLMLNKIARNINALIFTSVVLLIGLWLDIYVQVMPGITGKNTIGIIEAGMFLGFLGIFIFTVSRTLSKANLIPQNHPYLNESIQHKLH